MMKHLSCFSFLKALKYLVNRVLLTLTLMSTLMETGMCVCLGEGRGVEPISIVHCLLSYGDDPSSSDHTHTLPRQDRVHTVHTSIYTQTHKYSD